MSPDEVVQLIGGVGFPILVAWYFMTKLNKSMEILNATLLKVLEKLGGHDGS